MVSTEFQYVERSVFMKEVSTRSLWSYYFGTNKRNNVPIKIIIGFQQRDRRDSQSLKNDTFCRLPVTSAQCLFGTEKHPDSGILLSYIDDDYGQRCGQVIEAFKALTKNDILKPYISDHDFESSNKINDIGYNLYVFDIRYQKK